MKINPKIKDVLKEYNIPEDEGIACLLIIYFNLKDIPNIETSCESIFKQINISKIVERNYTLKNIIWNIPLFENTEKNDNWDWVDTEYRILFKNRRTDKGGSLKSCKLRMIEFFKNNPHIRKDDVIEAAKLYISTVSNATYLVQADYFIKKDKGVNTTSKLESYLEIIKQNEKEQKVKNQPIREVR